MQDPLLTVFVHDVERGRLPGLPVWVATPAGVFAGQIISTQRFYEETEARLLALAQEGPDGEEASAYSLADTGFIREPAPDHVPRYLYLHAARLLNGAGGEADQGAALGLARIDLEQIHAWSFLTEF